MTFYRKRRALDNGWRHEVQHRPGPGPRILLFSLLGALMFAGMLYGAVFSRDPEGGLPPTTAVPITPSPSTVAGAGLRATALPCTRAEVERQEIQQQIIRRDWAGATAIAEAVLKRADLCPHERTALMALLLQAELEHILDAPPGYTDYRAQQLQVTHYTAIATVARRQGISMPDALALADRAHAAGHFTLARVCLEEAWVAGLYGPGHVERIRQYASALYNAGYWLTGANNSSYQEGLRLLATSHQIDLGYGIGSGAAAQRLTSLVGPDPSAWPPADVTPLLPVRAP